MNLPLRLEALDSYFLLACVAVLSMSAIATFFIKGTPNQQVRGFVVCLLASIVASPLIGGAIIYGGIYSGVAAAIVVMFFVVHQFNLWADKKNPRRAEEPVDAFIPSLPSLRQMRPGNLPGKNF